MAAMQALDWVGHVFRRTASKFREARKRATRSPRWRAVEGRHLEQQPTCAGCGSRSHLQVHHVKPFHLHPELELEPTNLVTACMDTSECHFFVAHGGSFRAYNPNVRVDLFESLTKPSSRPYVRERAKNARKTA